MPECHGHPAAELARSLFSGAVPDLDGVVASSAGLDAAALTGLRDALRPLEQLTIESVAATSDHEAVIVGEAGGTVWRVVIAVEAGAPSRLTDLDFHPLRDVVEWDDLRADVDVEVDGDASVAVDRIGQLLGEVRESRRISGMVVAVVTPSTRAVLRVGFADPWTRLSARFDSRFRYSSLLKPWTALLVLRQVEAGALGLDDPVAPHCPVDVPSAITVRHLLTHTSGLDPLWPMPIHGDAPPPPDAPRALLTSLGVRAVAAPGAAVAYSNVGYGLLGLLLEQVTGESFGTLVASLAASLGCESTSLDEREGTTAGTALEGGAVVPVPKAYPLLPAASGGWGTAGDVVRFGVALLGDEEGPVTPSLRAMLLGGLGKPGAEGPLRAVDVAGHRCHVCVGGWPGFSGALALCLDTGLVVAALCNRSTAERGTLPVALLEAALVG